MKFLIRQVIAALEKIAGVSIFVKKVPRIKIKPHSNAVSNGQSMQQYVELIRKHCNYSPKNIFEVGANYAQDAEFLRRSFELSPDTIYIFEPHPQIISEVRKMYEFNSYELAVSNKAGTAVFHAIDINNNEYNNTGISSLRNGLTTNKKNFIDVEVEIIRMDDFIRTNNIKYVDFLKLDVEGANLEVLEGFGDEISKVKAIQTEGEYKQYWEDQKLFQEMADYLVSKNFLLIHFELSRDGIQSDSFWVQKPYLKSFGA